MSTGRGAARIRVLLTCDWFLKYTASQAAALVRAGADVLLLCRDHASEFGGDVGERVATIDSARAAGVRVVELPGRIRDPAAARAVVALRRALHRFDPGVVHAHFTADPRALALLPRAPTVLTIHDPAPHPGQPQARTTLKRCFHRAADDGWRRRADVIVVHSERLRDAVTLRRAQRCVVVPHGLDLHSEPLVPPRSPTVGFFGRLEPYKGLEVLARAMPHVWAARPDVELRIAGGGAVPVPLTDRRLHLQRAYLPEAEIEAFFASISVAVLPYTEASQTGAGSQAVGFGIPVIASRVGALPDLALDESYLVDPGDEPALSAAILRHVDDGAETRRRVMREIAAPRSWDAAAALSMGLYEELVQSR
jgi:glycosyltransferase involved in cell wall biosynthesis